MTPTPPTPTPPTPTPMTPTSLITDNDLIKIKNYQYRIKYANNRIKHIVNKLQAIKEDPDIKELMQKKSYWEKDLTYLQKNNFGSEFLERLLDEILKKLGSALKKNKTTVTMSYTKWRGESSMWTDVGDTIRFEKIEWICKALEKFNITHVMSDKETRHGVQRSGYPSYDDNWEEGPWSYKTTRTVVFTLNLNT